MNPLRTTLIGLFAVLLMPNATIAEDSSLGGEKIPTELAQAVLDHPALSPYWHPESGDRVPLVVSDNLLSSKAALFKFEEPVSVVADDQLTHGVFFRFDHFHISSDVTTILISYRIEGVMGRFEFVPSGNESWEIRTASVWET